MERNFTGKTVDDAIKAASEELELIALCWRKWKTERIMRGNCAITRFFLNVIDYVHKQ